MVFTGSMKGGIYNYNVIKENNVRTFMPRLAKEDMISDVF